MDETYRLFVFLVSLSLMNRANLEPTIEIKVGTRVCFTLMSESQVSSLLLQLASETNRIGNVTVQLSCPVSENSEFLDNHVEEDKPMNCLEMQERGQNVSGVATIYPFTCCPDRALTVYCDMETDGGGWTVIQRRDQYRMQEDFFRQWSDYAEGFGNVSLDFWLGNNYIHELTNQTTNQIRFDLEDFDGSTGYAMYNKFYVGTEDELFQLRIGEYSGNVGDSMDIHNGMSFSTKDQDNDKSKTANCADKYMGAWWYRSCHNANLNGLSTDEADDANSMFITWYYWHDKYSPLKKTEMKIRPLRY